MWRREAEAMSWSVALLVVVLAAAGCTGAVARAEMAAPPDAGGARTPAAAESAPPPPPSPPNPRLACHKDADCAFVDRPCACPPCGDTWREVMNTKELAKLRASWAKRRCRQPVCEACAGRELGTKAVCVRGQCAAR
jgi:hypothetical protein